MNSQLSERIRLHSANFSKGQRMIARYIEEHSEQVAFMTASRLGQTVGVSESTVVRFATEIGYSGYPALQQAMQEMIRSKMTSVQRLERTSTTIPMDRLLDEVLDQDIDILKRTKENVDREAFYRAADALVNAKKVYVLGAGLPSRLYRGVHGVFAGCRRALFFPFFRRDRCSGPDRCLSIIHIIYNDADGPICPPDENRAARLGGPVQLAVRISPVTAFQ